MTFSSYICADYISVHMGEWNLSGSAANSVDRGFSMYYVYLFFLVISCFTFVGRVGVLIVPAPDVCLRFTFMLHYENTPMQHTAIFHGSKNDHFQ